VEPKLQGVSLGKLGLFREELQVSTGKVSPASAWAAVMVCGGGMIWAIMV
jgi:hypothetical protein